MCFPSPHVLHLFPNKINLSPVELLSSSGSARILSVMEINLATCQYPTARGGSQPDGRNRSRGGTVYIGQEVGWLVAFRAVVYTGKEILK